MLRKYVKQTALKEKIHINTVWARLKRKYGFKRYRQISCDLFQKIVRDLPEITAQHSQAP